MKLEHFREKNTKKKGIVIFTICCVLLIAGVFFSSSFALFETTEHFNIIEDQIHDPKDLYFAYYINDEIVLDPPSKDSGYILASKSSCANGVTVLWDVEDWSAIVNYSNYEKNPNVRTKCNLYFEKRTFENSVVACGKLGESGASCMAKNAFLDTTNFMNDETNDNNLRYVGANPNNYVSFGGTYQTDIYDLYNSANEWQFGLNLTSLEECETFKSSHNFLSTVSCVKAHSKGDPILWRVIGVMNHIDDGNGVEESRIKVIRNDSTGPWSWDSSPSNINGGWGVNEWTESDMKTVLNDYYYNGKDHQTCYVTGSDANVSCNFSHIAFEENLKTLIENTLWHTGSNGDAYAWNEISAKNFYEMERGNLNGKVCASGSICNDGVERTTQWVGKIGLMYPSDYGYSTSGGDEIDRSTCIATFLYNWTDSPDCYNHSWLYNHGFAQWSMTPAFYPNVANRVYVSLGDVPGAHYGFNDGSGAWSRPVVYLNSKVRIINGEGTIEKPFEFSL